MSANFKLTQAQWEALYQRLEKPLYNLAYRYVWNCHEAQDLVQEAFLQLWRRREQIESETGDRYLWICVLNLARKRKRWTKLRNFLPLDIWADEIAIDDDPSTRLSEFAEHKALQMAIDELPEKLREVLLLTEFSEIPYKEVALLLAIPAGTVASRRNLAMKRLRSTLGEENEHE